MVQVHLKQRTVCIVIVLSLLATLGLFSHARVDATGAQQDDAERVIPSGLPVITTENASRLEPVAKLGRGSPQNLRWTADGSALVVIGFSSLWVYSADDFAQPIQHLEFGDDVGRPIDGDLSPDRQTAILAEYDKARLWDMNGEGEPILLSEVLNPAVGFSPDGRVAYSTADFSVELRNIESGEIVQFDGHGAYVRALSFNRDGLLMATASEDGTARLWNTQNGAELQQFALDGSALISVVLNPDGNLMAVSGGRGLEAAYNPNEIPSHPVGVFDLISNEQILSATTSIAPNTLSFSADGRSVTVAATTLTTKRYSGNQFLPLTVMLLNIESGTMMDVPLEDDGRYFRFSPRGDLVAVQTPFGPQILNTGDYTVHTTLPYFGWIRFIDFDENANVMMWQASYATQIVDLATGLVKWDLIGVSGRQFSPQGEVIATTLDGRVQWWDVETREVVREIAPEGELANFVLSSDGTELVINTVDGKITLWDVDTTARIFEGQLDPAGWGSLRYAEAEGLIIFQASGRVVIWDVESGDEVLNLSGLGAVGVSPDGRIVGYQVQGETTTNVMESQTGGILATFPIVTGTLSGIEFNNDGTWMIVGSSNYLGGDGAFHVIDIESLEEINRYEFDGFPWTVRFSPDDTLMMLSGEDEPSQMPIVQFWNLESGEPVGTVSGITGASLVEFNADQSIVITGAGTSAGHVIDTATAEELTILNGQGSGASAYRFSPDETIIATAAADGTMWLWGVVE